MSTKPHLVRKKSNSESKEVHVESLGADVHLYVTKSKEPYKVQYEIECNNFTQLKFTLDLHKSTNIRLMKYDNGVYVPEESLVITKKIRPFSKTEIGYIEEIDIYKSSRISTSYQWITETPDEEETERYMATYRATLKGRIDAASSVPFPPAAFDPENRKVIDIWNMHGKSFLDFDFLPLESSIFSNENSVLAHNNPEKLVRLKNIEWKRASDFMKADSIEVFQAGIEPADIIQGCLGDCWFLSALAALAEHPKLIHDIFPPCSKTYQQAGVYNVRFCKNGLWQTIRLDDYFPCFPGGGPIFSKSNGDELWVLLAEKAFAKIHGTYLAIQSGFPYEALMDLSGAPFQQINFPKAEELDVVSSEERNKVWNELSKFNRMDYILAASTRSTTELSKTRYGKDANSIGLVFNHAYSILDLRTTSHGDQIVKLRNPWGAMEWKGDWSDSSSKWTEEMQKEIEVMVNADDGIFWMSFQDLLIYFGTVYVCMERDHTSSPWIEERRQFYFELEHTPPLPVPPPEPDAPPAPPTPFCFKTSDQYQVKAPFYKLILPEASHIVFTIHQQDERILHTHTYIDVGFVIMRKKDGHHHDLLEDYEFYYGSGVQIERQNQSTPLDLPAGEYMIVPYSSGNKLRQFFEENTASIHHHGDHSHKKAASLSFPLTRYVITTNPVNGATERTLQFTQEGLNIFSEVFHRLDFLNQNFLEKDHLDVYMEKTEGRKMSDRTFDYLVSNYEATNTSRKGLSLQGFLAAQLDIAHKVSLSDPSKTPESIFLGELQTFGYEIIPSPTKDEQNIHLLRWTKGRYGALSIHALVEMKVTTIPFDNHFYQYALESFFYKNGKPKSTKSYTTYTNDFGFHGKAYLMENITTQKLHVSFDLSESKNILSSINDLKGALILNPGEKRILYQVSPNEDKGWSFSSSFSYYSEY